MKKLSFEKVLFVLVVMLFIGGCAKEDDTTEISGSVVGVWNCTALNYSGTTVTELMGQSITSNFTGEGQNIDFTLTFSENPNTATSSGTYDIFLTTTTLGQTQTQTIPDIEFEYTGTWSQNGNDLTIVKDGVPATATIVAMTETTLEVNITDVETSSINEATVTTTINSTIRFVK